MELTIQERIILSSLPYMTNMSNLKLLRKFTESSSFSDIENQALEVVPQLKCVSCGVEVFAEDPTTKCAKCNVPMQPTGRFKWNEQVAAVMTKDVHVDETTHKLVVQALKRLSGMERISQLHYSLVEKFVPEELESKEAVEE